MKLPFPQPNDPEAAHVAEGLPPIVDAHVHLFPQQVFAAMWKWFEINAWPVRYQMSSSQLVDFLVSRGIERILGLHYSHAPGIAKGLNKYMAKLCKHHPEVIGSATVFPGEDRATDILDEAFDLGLAVVKLHAHVQYFEMNSPAMRELYEFCSKKNKPLVMHVGREPRNPHFPYVRDPYDICLSAELERVLAAYPTLRICVPHLGADEFQEYYDLIKKYDNLWLDVSMAIADYLPISGIPPLKSFRLDRIMYGSDFPNIPYAWDRELKKLCAKGLAEHDLTRVCGKNVYDFLGIERGGHA